MGRLRTVRSSFNAGELMPVMDRRHDVDAYHNGAAVLRNFRLLPQGGVTRRPGTRLCAQLPHGVPYQAEDFTFDANQAYIFLFQPGVVGIYDNSGAGITTVTGPWTAAMIGELSVSQQGDTMFVVHEDMYPQKILRTGATSFVLQPFGWDHGVTGSDNAPAQPYYRYAPATDSVVVQFVQYADGNTTFNWGVGWTRGAIANLSCTYPLFQPGLVGNYIRINKSYWLITARTSDVAATGTLYSDKFFINLPSQPLRTVGASSWIVVSDPFHGFVAGSNVYITGALAVASTPSTEINGQQVVLPNDVTELSWNFNTSKVATEVIYGGGDDVRYWGNAIRTREWQEPAFSSVRGWPRSVTFEDQRLVFGGGKSLPNRLFESHVDAPFNFDLGTGRDNESIQAGIASQRVAIINAVVSYRHLQIFTSEGEYFCPGSEQKPLTPASVSFKRQSSYGIGSIPPVEFDGSTLYITRTGALREFLFNAEEGYQSPSLSFMAQHLLSGLFHGAVRLESQMEGSGEQESTAYVVRTDGRMAVLAFNRKEKVLGWVLWETQGQIKDIVSVNRRLFAVIVRGTKTFLEEFSQAYTLDCASTGDAGTPVMSWGGLTIYDGTTVRVLAGAREDLGDLLVSGAAVIFPKPVQTIEIGYGFNTHLVTLPPEVNLQDGPTQGQPRRVVRVRLELDQSLTAAVNGTHITLKRIEDVNSAPFVFTGAVEFWLRGWDDRGQVTVTCPEQGPLTIKSIVKELEF